MPNDDAPAQTPPSSNVPLDPARQEYQRALVAECRMLIDYLAADPAKRLRDLTLPLEAAKGRNAHEMLTQLGKFEAVLESNQILDADACAELNLMRDAIVAATAPATGTTVAFTAMVAGSRRSPKSLSRKAFAEVAYPGLIGPAVWLRWFQRFMVALAIVVTLGAVWYSTKVAMGKQFMQALQSLRAEQKTIADEQAHSESDARPPSTTPVPGGPLETLEGPSDDKKVAMFAPCEQPVAIAWYLVHPNGPGLDLVPTYPPKPTAPSTDHMRVYASPSQRDLCERDRLLALRFGLLQGAMRDYERFWTEWSGAFYRETGWFLSWAEKRICGHDGCAGYHPDYQAPDGTHVNDVEVRLAPELLVWGNYVMPVIFGLLGSLVYVILDLYSRMRASRLDPRDMSLSFTRMVLGLVTGACVGLFFSTYGPTDTVASGDLIGALTLSASGLAFLAGFGVEGVFTFLQSLVTRVFPAAPSK